MYPPKTHTAPRKGRIPLPHGTNNTPTPVRIGKTTLCGPTDAADAHLPFPLSSFPPIKAHTRVRIGKTDSRGPTEPLRPNVAAASLSCRFVPALFSTPFVFSYFRDKNAIQPDRAYPPSAVVAIPQKKPKWISTPKSTNRLAPPRHSATLEAETTCRNTQRPRR
jgi:hypothetical protein